MPYNDRVIGAAFRTGFHLFHDREQCVAERSCCYVYGRVAPVEVCQVAKRIPVASDQITAPRKIDADDAAMALIALTGSRGNAIQLTAEVEDIVVRRCSIVLPTVKERNHQSVMIGALISIVDRMERLIKLALVPGVAIILEFDKRERIDAILVQVLGYDESLFYIRIRRWTSGRGGLCAPLSMRHASGENGEY